MQNTYSLVSLFFRLALRLRLVFLFTFTLKNLCIYQQASEEITGVQESVNDKIMPFNYLC